MRTAILIAFAPFSLWLCSGTARTAPPARRIGSLRAEQDLSNLPANGSSRIPRLPRWLLFASAPVCSSPPLLVGRRRRGLSVDLTLGWRLMSNQEILDGLHLYRLRRAYAWAPRNGRLPASEQDITAHSANMHMVPSTGELAERLRAIARGDLVDIRGYLVEIRLSNGGIWRSSLTRTDTGDGACELVWVDELNKL